MEEESREVRVMKASRLLQAKVGIGPVNEKKLAKSQRIMDNMDFDFAPLAAEYIEQLGKAIIAADKGGDTKENLQALIEPVMQLKANAAMFGYGLVGSLATTVLNFLESLDTVDKNVLEIMTAHEKTLSLIIANQMKGDGGPYGAELEAELKEVCRRYFSKTGIDPLEDKDVFFID